MNAYIQIFQVISNLGHVCRKFIHLARETLILGQFIHLASETLILTCSYRPA
jgi:hypothetical protein